MPIFSRILPPTICLIFLALGAGFRLDGSATASSSINAGNLQITPANGVLAFDFPWTATAFTEALDSAGGFDQEFSSVDDAATQAGSSTPFSSGTAVSSALAYTAGAASGVNLPSVPASASSRARGAFLGMFHIAGVPGPVNVDFSADFTYSHVLQTLNAISASSEVAFSLTVDGGQTPLFLNNLLTLGPTGSASASSSGTLTGSLTLATNTPYSLYAEVDSESFGYDTPEPSTWLLVLAGLAGIVLRRRSPGWPRLTGLAAVLLTGSLALQAKYDGGDPPKCTECERSCPSCTEGTDISPTEGTMMQRLEFPGLQGGMGGGLNFGLNYNSYNADGSRSMMDTGLGYGWTHSFNGLLFNQRGSMFRYGPDGRITKFQAGPGSTFTPGPGYFDVLVRNPDSSFTLTRKDKTSYRFESVPDTPFLLAGPVYRLTKITDRNNNVITLTYAGGNLVKITDAYGRFLTLTYNGANRLTSVTDPLGHTTTFTYDPTGRDLRVVTDAAGKTTKFGYNALHQITQKVDRDGRIFNYQYAGGLPVAVLDGTSTLIYRFSNPANWATDATALAGTLTRVYVPSTTTKTDGLGRQWKYTYNSNGQVTSFQAPDGATTSYAYDPATLMVSSQTDANGHTTQYGYDALGNLIKVTDALAHVAAYTYEPVYNQMTSMTDANGRVTTYQYDGLGNRIKTIDPLGLIRTATYDSHGNVLTETDMRGNTTTYQYDSEGNRIKAVDALAETTTNSYDAAGNALTTTDPRGNTTTYQYDALNRRIQQTDALGGVATTSYDGEGNRTQATDASGHTTSYLYDQRSRPAKIINPQGGTISSTYDANNNRTAMTDQNGRTTRYTYDVRNRLTQTTDALNKADKTSYDATGNIVTRTDSNGHATTYVYDALDRMTQMTDAVGAVTRYAYDATGLAGCPQCTGPAAGSSNVTKLTDANGKVTHYKYDGLDRRIIQIRKEGDTADSIDGSDAVTRYGYDGNGNSTSLTEANGNAATYVYDAVNRRTQSTNAAGDVTSYTYDAAGNVQTRTSANGNVITYTYDALNRRTQAVDSQAPVVSYSYDAVGNRTNRTSTVTGITTTNATFTTNDLLTSDVHDSNGNTRTNGA
ncbi:MAG: PEP-CTERM sorting domain-containing protein, partial [Acidobacteria bacterium]|nr:PEP-CTERM sorting domain-containing protein [Acidobacteriota bacterium]